jgi:hypothetical protein
LVVKMISRVQNIARKIEQETYVDNG